MFYSVRVHTHSDHPNHLLRRKSLWTMMNTKTKTITGLEVKLMDEAMLIAPRIILVHIEAYLNGTSFLSSFVLI